jgi:VIT1/CCC1 family predicted Fe2+/Mn2+ transporter
VFAGGLSVSAILLTAVSGALAGAISMFVGEYIATKSQNEVLIGEVQLEKRHVKDYLEDEVKQLDSLFTLIGIPDDSEERTVRHQLKQYYKSNTDDLLKIMIALEFGVLDQELRRPILAGLTSGGVFVLGSLTSVIPFAVAKRPVDGIIAAGVITGFVLLLVGGLKTWATRGNAIYAALENFVISGIGAGIAYGVGLAFDKMAKT